MIKNWMTIDECMELFRAKRSNLTKQNVINVIFRHRVKKKHAHVGRIRRKRRFCPNRSVKQLYYKPDVEAVFEKYRPTQQFTLRITTPPPEGWYTLKYIAEYLGANVLRLQKLCSLLSIKAYMYNGKRYAELAVCEEYLKWRPYSFVRKHRMTEWIRARLKWQKESGMTPPDNMQHMYSPAIYAPELIHI